MKTAIFAGGCFWCIEHDLRSLAGVMSVVSGYTGGTIVNPTYEQVIYEDSEHREAVEVTYDETKISFKKLCQFFLDHIDPTDADGQFADRGNNYKTAIYFQDEGEETIARALLTELAESRVYEDKPIVVDVLSVQPFYSAEEEHQDYASKNPVHYGMYRVGSGREGFVNGVCQIREEKKINWKD